MPPPVRLGRAAWSWALFQGGRDPYVILVTIYIFAPYFTTVVIGDPVRGQTLAAAAATWAGWAVMLCAPIMGATVDRMGPRKPWLAGIVLLMVPLLASLWLVTPDGRGLSTLTVLAVLGLLSFLISVSETYFNALLVPAVGMRGAGAASGLGLALGNAVSVVLLIFVLVAFALPGKLDWAWLPDAPLFGLDPARHEADRLVGPLSAAVLALLCLPLFAFVRDAPATGMRLWPAIRAGAGDLAGLIREGRRHRNAFTYLGARMIFTDGLTGILVFSGVYAAGMLGWGTLDLLAYGLVLSIVAVGGGLFAGWLDGAVGPKRALQLAIGTTLLSQALTYGQSRTELFYQPFNPASPPLWDGPLFRTAPEVALVLGSCVGAIGVTAAYASSRTLLTRVAPADKLGVFFGLYALAGAATMWLAPLLVGIATAATGSQRLGLLPIAGLLIAGLVMLHWVQGGERLGNDGEAAGLTIR